MTYSLSSAVTPLPLRIIDQVVRNQKQLSDAFDRLLPEDYIVDGCKDFKNFALQHLEANAVVWDIGGGRFTFAGHNLKRRLNLKIVGLDISASELHAAAPGLYDEMVAADLLTYTGRADADLVICQSLLEHVSDVSSALRAIASILKPGGIALLFIPSRNAVYTKLNKVVPEELKSKLLRILVHGEKPFKAFPAYYDRCTPRAIRQLAMEVGFDIVEQKTYFTSAYFSFFVPLHILWRMWLLCYRCWSGDEAAETFALALRKTTV